MYPLGYNRNLSLFLKAFSVNKGHCLVIGGSGFVGSAISEVAAEQGWQVSIVGSKDYDEKIGQRFDLVINANGNAKRFLANRDPLFDFQASAASVYSSLFDFKYEHYVLVSTVDVYNHPSQAATTREDAQIELEALGSYAFHKRLAELFVMRNCSSWQIVRLAQMVGPNLSKGPIFDVLQKNPLWIDSATRLHFMSTRHVAQYLLALASKGTKNEIYNLCGRGNVEFRRVIDLLPPELRPGPQSDTEQQIYDIDTDKAHQIVPLPASWDEVAAFMKDAMPQGGER